MLFIIASLNQSDCSAGRYRRLLKPLLQQDSDRLQKIKSIYQVFVSLRIAKDIGWAVGEMKAGN